MSTERSTHADICSSTFFNNTNRNITLYYADKSLLLPNNSIISADIPILTNVIAKATNNYIADFNISCNKSEKYVLNIGNKTDLFNYKQITLKQRAKQPMTAQRKKQPMTSTTEKNDASKVVIYILILVFIIAFCIIAAIIVFYLIKRSSTHNNDSSSNESANQYVEGDNESVEESLPEIYI